MKKYLIYIFLFMFASYALAQNTFFNIYRTPQIETSFDAIMASDGNIIIVGKRTTTIPEDEVCGMIMKFDENGNFVNETTLVNPNRTYCYSIQKVPNYDNEFIIIGSSDSIVGGVYYSSIITSVAS